MNIKQKLKTLSDKKYKEFSSSLIPNVDNILGVRLPVLRKFANELYHSDYMPFLSQNEFEFLEEIMLQGMLIGLIEDNPDVILKYIKDFVPKINNWAVCDTFSTGLKFVKTNKKAVWKFIQPYLKSNKEYEIRFFYVMCLAHFVDNEYIDKILNSIDKFKDDGYYSKMAVAWALQVCFVKFEDKTFEYMKRSSLDDWTFNKAIQKMIESYKIPVETKQILKTLKRK